MRRLATLLLFVVLAAGCKTPGGPALPTGEQRAAYGDVAVVAEERGAAEINRPVTGWAAGLGLGTVRGLGAVVMFAGYGAAMAGQGVGSGSGEFGALVVLTGAALGAAVGAVYTPVSMIGGATTAPSGDEVAQAEVVIRPLAHDPGLAARFTALFVEQAQSQAGRAFVDPGAATTVVTLRIESIATGKTWDWYTFDRPFGIRVAASARVIRVADGQLVWTATRTSGDPADEAHARTYVEWAANGGEAFREEIDEALAALAAGFADSIFIGLPAATAAAE